MRFTDKQLAALKPQKSRYELVEDGGLAVRVAQGGAVTFAILLRVDGKVKRVTLGRYVAPGLAGGTGHAGHGLERLSLADARLRVAKARKLASAGKDPAVRAVEQHKEALGASTVRQLVNLYLERHAKPNKRSADEDERMLNLDVLPAWGDRRARDIARKDAIALLDTVVARKAPVAANRLHALLSKMFKFALQRDLIPGSPMVSIPKPGGKETARRRVLDDVELMEVWRTVGTLGGHWPQFVRLLVLTGQRRNEVAGMRWPEVSKDEKLWVIPGERTKSGLVHEVPLSDLTLDELAKLPRNRKEKPLLSAFPGRGRDIPVTEVKSMKLALDKKIAEARRERGEDPMPPWVLHDLRRTCRTGLSRLRVATEIAERVVGHVPAGVRAVYDWHDYRDEKRAALDAWARHVESLINPPAQNVVTLHAGSK